MQIVALLALVAILFLGIHLLLDAFERRAKLGAHDEDDGVVQFRQRLAKPLSPSGPPNGSPPSTPPAA